MECNLVSAIKIYEYGMFIFLFLTDRELISLICIVGI